MLFKRIFAWWDTTTFGTSLTLWKKKAEFVGEDEQGNKYYIEGGKPSFPDGRRRRWVIYHGVADASRVPPDWHGWLHHNFDEPPTKSPLLRQKFEKDHLPNMSGTPLAYKPAGSLSYAGAEKKTPSDYEAWSPTD